jgi:hypothetical protein
MLLLMASCKNENKIIVSASFIDSLISHYSDSTVKNAVETDLQFWKGRINPSNPGLVNELKYASCLVQRFHLTGNIYDIITADSILHTADNAFNHKEAAPNMALVRNSILQHRFKEADSLFRTAQNAGLKKYESAATAFDVIFELGHYKAAAMQLKQIADYKDFGYNFRYAKLAHYNGEVDTAIAAMHRAVELSTGNTALMQVALSNEADLNLHSSNLQRANNLYVQSIRLGATHLHSIMGLGWIALVHDKNDSLAEKIFRFVQSKTKAPDAIFKLIQVADAGEDTAMQQKLAHEFVNTVSNPAYGNMYNKYVLELYTGILHEPAKAEAMAARELLNRTTPQTYAWYVWALYSNNKTADAEKVYQQYVSGKPLEGLELYWMGKYMQGLNKNYNAKQFFKAAYKNRYDLSPAMVKDLEKALEK